MLLRSRKTLFILLIISTLVFGSNFAWAQGNALQVQKLEIEILPEYDTTDILVINAIDFKNTSNQDFTGELTWKAPKGSKTHIVTDNKQPDKHLQFEITSGEDFDVITWKLPAPIKPGEISSIHLEYYYNNLQGAPDKAFTFEFTPDYPVASAEVYVIQPITATNFKLTPEFGQAHQSDKFSFFVKKFFISPDNGIKIEGSYTKTDPNPSISAQQTPSGNQQEGLPWYKTNNTVKILLGLGIGIVIALLIYKEIRNRNTREDDENYDDEDDYEDNYEKDEIEEDKEDEGFDEDEENEDELDEEAKDDDEPENSLNAEERKLEEAYRDGRISESDYLEMLAELEEE